MKKETKYKILCGVGLFVYACVLFALSFAFMALEKHLTGSLSEKTMPIHITCICLLLIPPIVIVALNWDMVYAFLTRGNKKQRQQAKLNKLAFEKYLEEENELLRQELEVPDTILTAYEYARNQEKRYKSKLNWTLMGICEFLCLAGTVGGAFYFDLIAPELVATIMIFGLMFGIYGFSILCGAPVKGIYYSFLPVACFALPLAVTYYVLGVKTEWILGVSTLVAGSILFILWMIFAVARPYKRKEACKAKYFDILRAKFPKLHDYPDWDSNSMTFWRQDGVHVIICEYKTYCKIYLIGNVILDGIRLNDMLVEYQTVDCDYPSAIQNGLAMLTSYSENTIKECA